MQLSRKYSLCEVLFRFLRCFSWLTRSRFKKEGTPTRAGVPFFLRPHHNFWPCSVPSETPNYWKIVRQKRSRPCQPSQSLASWVWNAVTAHWNYMCSFARFGTIFNSLFHPSFRVLNNVKILDRITTCPLHVANQYHSCKKRWQKHSKWTLCNTYIVSLSLQIRNQKY